LRICIKTAGTDESHRSQYGILANVMRGLFRNATIFGFTGTPLTKPERNTFQKFSPKGELYLNRYGMLNSVEGRVLDTVRTKEGRIIFGGCFVYLLWEIEEIDRFQITQENLEHISIKIVRRRDVPHHKLQEALNLMRKELGETVSIDVQFVDQIPLTPHGKLRVVTSKVPFNFAPD